MLYLILLSAIAKYYRTIAQTQDREEKLDFEAEQFEMMLARGFYVNAIY